MGINAAGNTKTTGSRAVVKTMKETFSPQENYKTKEIENLHFLYAQTRADIILVVLGLKPATVIESEVSIKNGNADPKIFITEEQVENLYEVIRQLGIPYRIMPRRHKVDDEQSIGGRAIKVYAEHLEVFVGANEQAVESLARAWPTGDLELRGRALGIPETTTEALIGKRERLDLATISQEELASEAFIFSPTRVFSKDNWRNEIEEGKRRAEALKRVSPGLYEEIMNKYAVPNLN